jgi:hypothetical protein
MDTAIHISVASVNFVFAQVGTHIAYIIDALHPTLPKPGAVDIDTLLSSEVRAAQMLFQIAER